MLSCQGCCHHICVDDTGLILVRKLRRPLRRTLVVLCDCHKQFFLPRRSQLMFRALAGPSGPRYPTVIRRLSDGYPTVICRALVDPQFRGPRPKYPMDFPTVIRRHEGPVSDKQAGPSLGGPQTPRAHERLGRQTIMTSQGEQCDLTHDESFFLWVSWILCVCRSWHGF